VYRMFFLGRNFLSDLLCILKHLKKPKNFFQEKLGFSSPDFFVELHLIAMGGHLSNGITE